MYAYGNIFARSQVSRSALRLDDLFPVVYYGNNGLGIYHISIRGCCMASYRFDSSMRTKWLARSWVVEQAPS